MTAPGNDRVMIAAICVGLALWGAIALTAMVMGPVAR